MNSSFLTALLVASSLIGSPDSKKSKEDPPSARPMDPDMANLTGYYSCKGQEAGGKKYTGVVFLEKKNDVYLIQWTVGNGSNFAGIAIRQGNILAASWSITTDRGIVRGVNLYRVEAGTDGPRLVGRWASVPGPGIQQAETLTFLKKIEEEGD